MEGHLDSIKRASFRLMLLCFPPADPASPQLWGLWDQQPTIDHDPLSRFFDQSEKPEEDQNLSRVNHMAGLLKGATWLPLGSNDFFDASKIFSSTP